MKNIVIVENEMRSCKKIINYLAKKNKDIKLYRIASSTEEAIKMMSDIKEEIHLILINYELYKVSENAIKLYLKNYDDLIISNSIYDKINNYIKIIVTDKTKGYSMKRKIDEELRYLNYNFRYNGTKYLAEVIFELYGKKDNLDFNFKRSVYPVIAKKYRKSENTIYCNIKQATKNMILDCKEEIIMEYFNYSYFVKPKIKEIIFTVLNKI